MRILDHFVMPVVDLATARARFTALGFTIAQDANHPFGTQNCCIFFGDGTFIEPLAIGNLDDYAAALRNGNLFVKGHAEFTTQYNAESFSHLVVKSDSANEDHADYIDAGVSAGNMLNFGRTFTKQDGTKGEVAFSLAFAKAPVPSTASFFACEVVKSVPGGRGALVDHINGAKVTIAVIATAADPMATDDFLELFLDTESTAGSEIYYPLESGALRVMRPDVFRFLTEVDPPKSKGLSLAAVIIGVVSLDEIQSLVRQNHIVHHEKPGWVIVPPAAGQPTTLIFQSPQ